MVEKMVKQILKQKNTDVILDAKKIVAGEFYFKACNNHIFGNSFPSFVQDVIACNGIHRGDHIHIFIDQMYDDFKMDVFIYSLRRCYEITGKKIMIHVPEHAQFVPRTLYEKLVIRIPDVIYRLNTIEINIELEVVRMRKPVNFVYKYKGWADRFKISRYISVYTYENTLVAKRSNLHH